MSLRNRIALALTLLSFILLYLGLTLPALTITLTSRAGTPMGELEATVLDQTRSILSTIENLYDEELILVASLILLFSVIVPVLKGLLVMAALGMRGGSASRRVVGILRRIGKWSMADVMVVAIFLAYLSTRYQEDGVRETLQLFGAKIEVLLSSQMISSLEPGFYWFLAYCLVSLGTLDILDLD
jgi:paraquat-inducible protein A